MFEIDPILEKQAEAYNANRSGTAFILPAMSLALVLAVPAAILSYFGYHFLWWVVAIPFAVAMFGYSKVEKMETALKATLEPPPTTYGDARFMSAAIREDERTILNAYGDMTIGKPENHFLGFCRMNAQGMMRFPDDSYHPQRTGPAMGINSAPMKIEYGQTAHLLTVAPSRSGKGTDVIVPNLMNSKGRSLIVIDPKGENAAMTQRHRRELGDVFLLNPFNELRLGTDHFNPLSHLSIAHPRVVADCRSIAEALVPNDPSPSGNSSYFNRGARRLVQALLLHLLETKGRAATLTDIRPILSSKDTLDRALFEMTEKSAFRPLRELAAQFVKEIKSVGEIISAAQDKTDFLSEPAFEKCLSKSDFEFIDLKSKPITVYVILPSRYLETYSAFLRLMMVSALDELQTADGGDVPTTFILDEFSALGYLSHFEDAIGKVAGYGVQLWPFVQDLPQLKSLYGGRWESFIANAGVVQWFAPQDQFTQDYLSKRMGQKTVVTRSKSSSKGSSERVGGFLQKIPFFPSVTESDNQGESFGETGRPLMAPSELAGLGRHYQIITYAGYSYPLKGVRFPYYFTKEDVMHLGIDEDFATVVSNTFGWFDLEPNPYISKKH